MEHIVNAARSAIFTVSFSVLCGLLSSCGGDSDSSEPASTPSGSSGNAGTPSAPPADSSAGNLAVSNDVLLSEQWYIANDGQIIGSKVRGTPGVDINALRAWTITRGSPDVVVAVIDSGVAIDHPDLIANIWTNPGESGNGRESNGIDDDSNGFVDDVHGWNFISNNNDVSDSRAKSVLEVEANIYHGTAVSSLIAATGNNAIGMSGIAPGVRIMPLKALSEGGVDDHFANAVLYARDKGAKIINLSVATFIPGLGFPKLAQAIKDSPNVLVIASAGNSGNNADIIGPEPCNNTAPNLLCIAATDQDDRLAKFRTQGSNYGYKTVDIAAPGSNIVLAQGATENIFSEGFEGAPAARWAAGGNTAWSFSTANPLSGASSLTFQRVANIPAGRDQIRMLQPIDLAGRQGCMLDFMVNSDLSGSFLVSLLGSTDGRVFSALVGAQGFQLTGPVINGPQRFQVPMTFFAAAGKAYLGFEFNQFATGLGASGQVRIDDLAVSCTGNRYGDRSYAYGEGTSFSTPLVSGTAALAFSFRPNATVAQVKNAILMGAVPNPELFGWVKVPGRLDAYRTLLAMDFAPDAMLPKSVVFNSAAAAAAAPLAARTVSGAGAGTLLTDLLFPLSLNPLVEIPGFLSHYSQQTSWITDLATLRQDPSYKNNERVAKGIGLPEAVTRSLENHGAKQQKIGQSPYCLLALLCPVAADHYEIEFEVTPGSSTTAKRLFDQLLRELPSGFAGQGSAANRVRFINTFNYLETDLQTGARRPEIGSIIHINIPGEEQLLGGAEIIIADLNESDPNNLYFTVATMDDPKGAMGHPVWGAREFRVKQDGNRISISTSGLDSPGNLGVLLGGTKVQAVGWMSLRDSVQTQLENGAIPGYVPNTAKKTNRLQYLSSLD